MFLASDTGGGHRAAAEAVEAALEERYPGRFRVRIADPFGRRANPLLHRVVSLYSPMVRHAPPVWGTIYHATNSRPAMAALVRAYAPLVGGSLLRLLAESHPVLVASYHPLTNHVTARLLHRRTPRLPLITIVTDLVDFHVGWMSRAADLIVVPSREAQDLCQRRGIPRDRIVRLGLPIHPKFARALEEPLDRPALRAALGLDPHRCCILLTGGAEGAGRLWPRVRALAASGLPLQLLVVCGRNAALLRRVSAASWPVPVRAVGFVEDMPRFMLAADVIVTKAGPATVSESLALGLPVILTSYIPGQEAANVEYVLRQGAGRFAASPGALIQAVRGFLQLTPAEWEELRARARSAADPQAAYAVARLIARRAETALTARSGRAT